MAADPPPPPVADHVHVRDEESGLRVLAREVDEGDAEEPDRQRRQRVLAHRLSEDDARVDAPAGFALDEDRAVVAVVIDRGDGRRAIRLDAQREARALAIDQRVQCARGSLGEGRIAGHDRDRRGVAALRELGCDREERDDHGEDPEGHRRDVEEARSNELRVLPPGDVGRVRERRLVTGGRPIQHGPAHATSRPGATITVGAGAPGGDMASVGSVAAECPT